MPDAICPSCLEPVGDAHECWHGLSWPQYKLLVSRTAVCLPDKLVVHTLLGNGVRIVDVAFHAPEAP